MKTISWRQSQQRTTQGSSTKGFRTAAGNRMVSMAERITPLPLTSSRADQIFPTLTSVQIERVATHGRRRAVRSGEVLVEQGDRAIPFFRGYYRRTRGGAADMCNRNAYYDRPTRSVHWRNQHAFRSARSGADSRPA